MKKKIEEIINREDTCEQAFPCHYKKDSIDQLLQLFKDSVRRAMPEIKRWPADSYENGYKCGIKQFKQNLEKEIN